MLHLIVCSRVIPEKTAGNGVFSVSCGNRSTLEKSSIPNQFIIPLFCTDWKHFFKIFFPIYMYARFRTKEKPPGAGRLAQTL